MRGHWVEKVDLDERTRVVDAPYAMLINLVRALGA